MTRVTRAAVVAAVTALLTVLGIAPVPAGAAPTGDGSGEPRVINGAPGPADDFGFLVALGSSAALTNPASLDSNQFCGGSLVAPTVVVTAAHCVTLSNSTTLASPASMSVGRAVDLRTPTQVVAVTALAAHPDYNPYSMVNDVAVMTLATAMPGPYAVIPSGAVAGPLVAADTPARTAGWGATGSGYPSVYRVGSLFMVSGDACSGTSTFIPSWSGGTVFTGWGAEVVPASMLCAAGELAPEPEDIVDACVGDSGGPLIVGTGATTRLVGAVSWGYYSGGTCITSSFPSRPGVYASLPAAKDFLRDNGVPVVGLPGAPTGVGATSEDHALAVTWTPPADPGSGITSYSAVAEPGGATCAAAAPATATATGLTNGTAYTVTVRAMTADGAGPASAASAPATPLGRVPGAPASVTASAVETTASVSWQPPADHGSDPVTSYTATASAIATASVRSGAGGTCSATGGSRTCAIEGLSRGVSYAITVTATNVNGTGPASTAVTVTPPLLVQQPVRPFVLPRRLANTGGTVLVDRRIVTNAGLVARVSVSCRRIRTEHSGTVSAVPGTRAGTGDRGSRGPACRVRRTESGRVRVVLPGTARTRVNVAITAPAVDDYAAYSRQQRYLTRAVR